MASYDLLISRSYTPMGTFGQMVMPDGQILYTVEDRWNDNKVGLSCIPEGDYDCEPRPFHRGGYDAVHIMNVPERSLILFHIANTHFDIRGCIGVGTRLGCSRGLWAILDSKIGFGEFMKHYGELNFKVRITQYSPAVSYGAG